MKKALFIVLYFLSIMTYSQNVVINEYMASNSSIIIPGYSGFEDWVELKNTTSAPYDLIGHYFTDSKTEPTKFQFSSSLIIPANGYVVIVCSGIASGGINHTNFKISESEKIGLVMPDGYTFIDSLTIGKQRTNISYGRNPSNILDWKYMQNPSPNVVNNFSVVYSGILDSPTFSHQTGFFSAPFSLSINHSDPLASITYTTDSSIPLSNNFTTVNFQYKNKFTSGTGPFLNRSYQTLQYVSPISIVDKSALPNVLSMISSTISGNSTIYYLPTTTIDKATVIRAIASKAGYLNSDVITNTFFINSLGQNPYSIPIISLNTQENNLFEYNNGIYTAGIDADLQQGSGANFRRDQEYPIHFEILENSTSSFKQDGGFQIHGNWSRSFPMKSLNIYSRSEYGKSEINYPIFPSLNFNSYKRFMLRNSGNDLLFDATQPLILPTMMRDAFIHMSVKHLNVDTQEYRPVSLFLNGEFWGLHNLREKYDKHYFEQYYGVNPENLDIIKNIDQIEEGDLIHFNAMQTFINSQNMALTSNYNYIKTQMDIENYIDYQIAEIYYCNADWIANNVQHWRERVPYNATAPKGQDGRWRWMIFDLDFAMQNPGGDILPPAVANQLIFGNLLDNQEFKTQFLNRFADLINTTFLPSRLIAILNEYKNKISPIMPKQIQRWKNIPDLSTWQANVNSLVNFVTNRPGFQIDAIKNQFLIGKDFNLTVNVSNVSHGFIKINTINIESSTIGVNASPYPWTGKYFGAVPVQLTAKPRAGFKFKHWLENTTIVSTDSIYVLSTTVNKTFTAVFESAFYSANPIPLAKTMDGCGYKFTSWAASNVASSYPENAIFVYLNQVDPIETSIIEGFTTGLYNFTSKTRINGLGSNGVSFINTGSGNTGYPSSKLGGMLLAINTLGQDSLYLNWKAGTVTPNSKEYAIRLQYRIGDLLPFSDLLDANGQPIIYQRNSVAGHEQSFLNIKLPASIMNNQYIQLFWKYYYTGVQNSTLSGSRDELRIDDIEIHTKKVFTSAFSGTLVSNQYSEIISTSTVNTGANIELTAGKSITLKPGFNTSNNSVFLARIANCPN